MCHGHLHWTVNWNHMLHWTGLQQWVLWRNAEHQWSCHCKNCKETCQLQSTIPSICQEGHTCGSESHLCLDVLDQCLYLACQSQFPLLHDQLLHSMAKIFSAAPRTQVYGLLPSGTANQAQSRSLMDVPSTILPSDLESRHNTTLQSKLEIVVKSRITTSNWRLKCKCFVSLLASSHTHCKCKPQW